MRVDLWGEKSYKYAVGWLCYISVLLRHRDIDVSATNNSVYGVEMCILLHHWDIRVFVVNNSASGVEMMRPC